jgi:signal transduction histidine kinase
MGFATRCLVFVIALLWAAPSYGWQDSLLKKGHALLHLPTPSAHQLWELYDVTHSIRYNLPDTALAWAGNLREKAKAAGENKLPIFCIYLESVILNIKGQYLLSITKAEEGIGLSDQIKNDSLKAVGYNGAGLSYIHSGKFDEALRSLNMALKIRERINDRKGTAATLCSLGQLYYESQNIEEAIRYLDQVLADKNNETVLLQAMHTRANIYGMQGNYKKALELDRIGLKRAKKMNAIYAYSMFYDNMANCYLFQNKLDPAKEFYYKSLEVDSMLDNKKQMGDTYTNLASLEHVRGNQKKAIQLGHRALQLMREADARMGVNKAIHLLAKTYATAGMFQEAYEYRIMEADLKDSILNEKTRQKLDEFNVLYETTKKEAEIKLLKKQQQINKLSLVSKELLIQKRNYQMLAIGGIIVLLSIVFYLLYNRQQLHQRQRNEKAVLDAEYKERARIARDVHDDLGSGLSRISLMAEVAKGKVSGDQEIGTTIRHIAGVSKELVENMRDLVWVLNPENTTPDNLVSRIREYIGDYLEEADINAAFDLPEHNPDIKLPREVQRNIFLTVKEAIHNAVKHSGARNIGLQVSYEGNDMLIQISDDGHGFLPMSISTQGNGLKNMRQRIEGIGGSYEVQSGTGKGTVIKICVPLPHFAADSRTFIR